MTKHIGITIGPVFDTISMTSSPAGLWAASYMFSHISRRLCELIVDRGLVENEGEIISPYYCKAEQKYDGIGRFHDRIIFKPKNAKTALGETKTLFDKVAKEVAAVFVEKVDKPEITEEATKIGNWFKQYLQLHAVCFDVDEKSEDEDERNPIIKSSVYLDAIELEKTFPTGGSPNPITGLFEDEDKNRKIKERFTCSFALKEIPFLDREDQDKAGNKFKRIPKMDELAGRADETDRPRRKIKSYYAIVQSDGDKIGEYIKDCKKRNESERDFSKKCLMFCSAAASKIKEYGGVPIYAGGDDLLFIAPLESPNIEGENILTLLECLTCKFGKYFGVGEGSPTLSFGVAIRYCKYPLYEAFDEAYKLLGDRAKVNRDAAAISLQKHSGQSAGFVIERFSDSPVTGRINAMIENRRMGDDFLKSVSAKIRQFQPLFKKACEEYQKADDKIDLITNCFANTFDANAHRDKAGGLKGELVEVANLLKLLLGDKDQALLPVRCMIDEGKDSSGSPLFQSPRFCAACIQAEDKGSLEIRALQALCTLDGILRFVRFFSETGEED